MTRCLIMLRKYAKSVKGLGNGFLSSFQFSLFIILPINNAVTAKYDVKRCVFNS